MIFCILCGNHELQMKDLLTDIQKEKFLGVSGMPFLYIENRGHFETAFPFNDKEWAHGPWNFAYVIDEDTGNLFCELEHRLTNNRVFGWDKNGNDLPDELVEKYFPKHM